MYMGFFFFLIWDTHKFNLVAHSHTHTHTHTHTKDVQVTEREFWLANGSYLNCKLCSVVNPRRLRKMATVVILSICLSFCLSVPALVSSCNANVRTSIAHTCVEH